MSQFSETFKSDLIEKILEKAEWRLGQQEAAKIAPFVRHYYLHVPNEDLHRQSVDNLFGAAFAHWRLAAHRPAATPLLRAYNPGLEEHGWRCEHSVVEVVTDDMPFLVDSVTAELNRRDLSVHLAIHPVYRVVRSDGGDLVDAFEPEAETEGGNAESFMHVEITRQSDQELADIAAGIEGVLADVRIAVDDWQGVRGRVEDVITELDAAAGQVPADEVAEVKAFLEWIYGGNFTLLGYRRYEISRTGDAPSIAVVDDSGLGILRDPEFVVFDELRSLAAMPPAVRAFIARSELLVVTKANRKSTVHRSVHLDTLIVRQLDAEGRCVGEHMFVGLFTAAVYNRSVRDIPVLRKKLTNALERSHFDRRGHDGRALMNIIETFPRDELFQVSDDHLFATARGILHLLQRQRVALFLRRDDFERFISCLIYIPRDRYTTELRLSIQGILERAFAGEVTAHYAQVGDSPMARLQIFVRTKAGEIPEYDAADIEEQIADATRSWSDHLQHALVVAHGEEDGYRFIRQYAEAFPPGYRENFNAEQAVADIEHIERALANQTMSMALYRPFAAEQHQMRFKVYQPDRPLVLSQVMPMLEHLGVRVLDEIPYRVRTRGDQKRSLWIHDFGLELRSGGAVDLGAVRDNFHQAFRSVWQGEVESDFFNSLVLAAELTCRQVIIIRAYCKYLRQAGIAFSQAYMEQTLAANPKLTRHIVELFEALFDPDGGKEAASRTEALRAALASGLDEVTSADEDRIIRRFLNAVESTLRTNYYQKAADGTPKPYLSFKLDSRRIEDLPLPRPMAEIFVYSPRVEGVHLRGGKVARGGIRWSDRREDFRTEILGLMKAQMVKNAVIVPVGAKGGFVVKQPPPPGDREAYLNEGIACYKTLIRGLLDITDNLDGADLVPPPSVVRRDEDDPYLVVAADKGTATFSDIANGISKDYRFWLGDAFASGGSVGYDHKKMGITARGAWESVKRNFREFGVDTQSQDFTVIGVGDMSGDVFGNGMLLSTHIKLLAGFNHLHIFVDPDPDPEASFAERKRLFALERSSWGDYDPGVLSKGGAIFERRAKSLTLTPEIRDRFGIEAQTVTPGELITILLKTEVDLLWFGGIGTFVKGGNESNADVGDRANDAVRVNGEDLRCKVIGEGANLGITQFGRIAFARGGGRINTDFIDNSAGVDCSDHEVNIKILLDRTVADGDLTEKQRNSLLADMTDEVGELVLRDNYLQTQAITLIEEAGVDELDNQIRLLRLLERSGRLNRDVEFLPNDEALAERAAARQGLTRPEISVLFSYCKVWLYDEILDSDLPDDRHLAEDVVRYFPSRIQDAHKPGIAAHRLRRELIATSITNSLINRVGGTFVTEIAEKTGRSAVDITRAYIVARDVFSAREVWEGIEALDNVVPASVQTTLHREVQRLINRATLWFLANGGSPIDISANIASFDTAVTDLAAAIESVLPAEVNDRILHRAGRYIAEGVPEDLARRVAYLIVLPSACDIVRIAAARGIGIDDVARLYFEIGEFIGFGWLRYQAEKFDADSYWQKLAIAAVIEELYAHQREVAISVIDNGHGTHDGVIPAWTESRRQVVDRTLQLVNELQLASNVDLSMLTVATRQIGALAAS